MCLFGSDKALYYLEYYTVHIDDICKLSNAILGTTVVLYADDILFNAPSVSVNIPVLVTRNSDNTTRVGRRASSP